MQELQVSINQTPGVIDFNYEELKRELSVRMSVYQDIQISEESKTIAKKELASLRKVREAVEKRCKEVKEQAMVPYKEFEARVKELVAIIDEPIQLLDKKIKEIEQERIRQKELAVRGLWEKVVEANGGAEYLPLDKIYDPKWNNAGTTLKNVEKDLMELATKTANEVMLIRNSNSDVMDTALDKYKETRDLSQALTIINTYESNKRMIMEREEQRRKEEEECRRQQEIERAREEERKKLLEIEQARQEERKRAELSKPDPDGAFEVSEEDELPFAQPTTKTVFYKVVATPEELEQVEMAFNSIGIFFERRHVNE